MKKFLAIFFAVCLLSLQQLNAQPTVERDVQQVKLVLGNYKAAVEALDASKTQHLFAPDSRVFESGGVEGTYANYLDHHLAPELKVFKSFNYSDYKVDVQVDGPYAFATETYTYTIVLAKDGSTIKKKGVATSILKKSNGTWQIMSLHSSSRNTK
ncbi:nuclear transport factor 2 family protein [Pontibacter sp. BT310]|uniref:Nuclear transport factor 2 family protein n=1 Tax=Pontibacter populi TaxID=890055 RepID=A0ABS6XIE4_9BACT|nr:MULTISPECIES: nuclear transport factor 2 family protein [Pontibacter]MBJ6120098.1 nuclear transport factor 2 family protein [Pontibacter sp. BT310]MBR0572531.1 nuclear transport factor 2 family protein [Microvirga sp. STS03]MBW3366951.1 nuclear transport factor 2 family protein [Pontibacter populi]